MYSTRWLNIGFDIELGIGCLGDERVYSPARLVQKKIRGARRSSSYAGYQVHGWNNSSGMQLVNGYGYGDGYFDVYESAAYNPQDQSGRFLTNGGSIYIDLEHPEICSPECTTALDFLKYKQAMLAVAQSAADEANEELEDATIVLYNDNTDRLGNAYGSHINVRLSARTWQDMFETVLFPHLPFLGSFQASAIVFTGGGKVGLETGVVNTDYQICRRAEFIQTFVGPQTTFNRPLINSRNEALSNSARLHTIHADSTLLHAATFLTAGSLQLVCSMIDAGVPYMNPALCLEDPLQAMHVWSADPQLKKKMRLISGLEVTAVEHQQMFIDEVSKYVDAGNCTDVKDADFICEQWNRTIEMLRENDLDAAARRVEWLCKYRLLDDHIAAQASLGWDSPEIMQLDLLFSLLDQDHGIYWQLEKSDLVETMFESSQLDHYMHQPPEDTRAWLRGHLIQSTDTVISVDWDRITVSRMGQQHIIHTPDVGGDTSTEHPLESFSDVETLITQLIENTKGESHDRTEPTKPQPITNQTSITQFRRY